MESKDTYMQMHSVATLRGMNTNSEYLFILSKLS